MALTNLSSLGCSSLTPKEGWNLVWKFVHYDDGSKEEFSLAFACNNFLKSRVKNFPYITIRGERGAPARRRTDRPCFHVVQSGIRDDRLPNLGHNVIDVIGESATRENPEATISPSAENLSAKAYQPIS